MVAQMRFAGLLRAGQWLACERKEKRLVGHSHAIPALSFTLHSPRLSPLKTFPLGTIHAAYSRFCLRLCALRELRHDLPPFRQYLPGISCLWVKNSLLLLRCVSCLYDLAWNVLRNLLV